LFLVVSRSILRHFGSFNSTHRRRIPLLLAARTPVCIRRWSALFPGLARFVSVLLLSRLLLRRAALVHSCSFTKGTKRRTTSSHQGFQPEMAKRFASACRTVFTTQPHFSKGGPETLEYKALLIVCDDDASSNKKKTARDREPN
jgi:hypothetical protein